MSGERSAETASPDECPLGPCEHPIAGYPCEFHRSCAQFVNRVEDNGYSLIRTGEVPPWMEKVGYLTFFGELRPDPVLEDEPWHDTAVYQCAPIDRNEGGV